MFLSELELIVSLMQEQVKRRFLRSLYGVL
nr:MAG TPA: hypothetical protein [Caudoviricetes sp.]